MPTKVNPHPGPSGAGSKAGSKPKPRLFDNARFTAATTMARDFSDISKERGQGSLSSVIFIALVGFAFLGLGLFLVIHGDENNILDLIVLGGLLQAMGVGTLLLSLIFIIVPVFKERSRRKLEARNVQDTAMPKKSVVAPAVALPSTPSAVFPGINEGAAFSGTGPMARTSSSSAAPGDSVLYDRESLSAAPDNDRRGKLVPPPPPNLSLPSKHVPDTVNTDTMILSQDFCDSSTQSDDDNMSFV